MDLIYAHFILALILFFTINWIGKHSTGYIRMSVLAKADEAPAFNFLYRAFSPVAYITVVSAIAYQTKFDWVVKDIYLVVIYYFVFRLAFNLLTERGMLLNWFTQIAYIVTSVPLSYYVYKTLIIHKEFLFPTTDELGSAIWLAIAAYVYKTFNSVKLSDERTKVRKSNYLHERYKTYKNKYGTIIAEITDDKEQEALIFAVLIVETFNRPKIYRLIENILFFFGFAKTLGVMQVTTSEFITDEESVKLGAKKIVNDFIHAQLKIESHPYSRGEWAIRREVIELYNPDIEYILEVDGLYNEIHKTFYSKNN